MMRMDLARKARWTRMSVLGDWSIMRSIFVTEIELLLSRNSMTHACSFATATGPFMKRCGRVIRMCLLCK